MLHQGVLSFEMEIPEGVEVNLERIKDYTYKVMSMLLLTLEFLKI